MLYLWMGRLYKRAFLMSTEHELVKLEDIRQEIECPAVVDTMICVIVGPIATLAVLQARLDDLLPRGEVRGSALLGGVMGYGVLCWCPEQDIQRSRWLVQQAKNKLAYWDRYMRRVQQATKKVGPVAVPMFPEGEEA
jgi:hypothetical protein